MISPPAAFEKPTIGNEQIKSKNFIILSEDKKQYNVLFENYGNSLILSAEIIEPNTIEKIRFENKFSLLDIQKVKLFQVFDTIDECLSEIFNFIELNKGIIKVKNSLLSLIIPLNSKKYPEISFELNQKEKNDSEKIKELYNVIHKLNEEKIKEKKENDELKKKIERLENSLYFDIEILGKKEEVNGISIEFFIFGENEFHKFIDNKWKFNENDDCLTFNFKVKNIDKINDFKKFIDNNKEVFDESLSDKKINIRENVENNIYLDLIAPIIDDNDDDDTKEFIEIIKNIINTSNINELKNIKIVLKSDFQIQYLFENKNFQSLFDEFLKLQFYMKGLTINSKFFLLYLINTIKKDNENSKIKDTIFSLLDKIKPLLLISSRKFYFFLNEEIKNKIYNCITETSEDDIENLDIKELIESIIEEIKQSIKNIELLENINFDEFTIYLSFIQEKIGFGLKFNLQKFNEVILEQIIKK